MEACPACSEENAPKARFCWNCGTRLQRADRPQRVRKHVTVLFTDVVDSTALGRRLEVERLSRVLERFFEVAREVLERHDGRVQKYLGDAVMAVFGLPKVHVDDPLRAVRAALELHARIRDLNVELRRDWGVELTLHTAIGTGEVLVEEGETWELGVAAEHINLVSELIKAASADTVLIANATYQRVRGSVKAEPVHAPSLSTGDQVFNVLELSERTPPRLMTPMVGRDWEMDCLRVNYDGVLHRRNCRLVSVLGPPGIGKTRLVEEFVRSLSRRKDLSERPHILRGLCLRPAGDSTFFPMRQVIRQAAGIRADASVGDAMRQLSQLVDGNESIVARLAPFIGLPGHAAEPEDTVRAICRTLEAAARRAPLVLAVDDLHWAEQPMLDILERVKEWLTDVPVLMIAVSRPEFFDEERDWAGWMRNTGSVTVEPLRPAEIEQMMGHMLLGGDPDPDVVTAVVEKTAGSPLDVEALMQNVLDDGMLRLEEGRWVPTGDIGALRTLLTGDTAFAARIERLDEVERRLVVRASIIGPQFRTAEVAALLPELDRATVAATLSSLVRKELLKPTPADAVPFEPGDDSYSFRHVRYQRTAYARLSREDRVDLHKRYADCLTEMGEDTPATADRIAFHLERSHADLVELRGAAAAGAGALAQRAGESYVRAGRGYITQGAFPVPYADRAFTRAVDLLPDGSPEQLQARLDLADTVQEPEPTRAAEIYTDVAKAARRIGSRLIEHHANFGQLEMRWFLDADVDFSTDWRSVVSAVEEFDATGQRAGSEVAGPHLRAKAYRLQAHALWAMGKITASLAAADRAISLIKESGDARLHAKIVRTRCTTLFWGPMPLEMVAREIQQRVDWARREGLFSLEAAGLNLLARAAAMQGEFHRARKHNHDARQIKATRPDLLTYALDVISEGMVEACAGKPEEAERILRANYENQTTKELTIQHPRSTVAALIARVLLQCDRDEEAGKFIEACREASKPSQLDSQIKWRHLRAVLLARRGEYDEAVEFATAAVELAQASEQPLSRAEAFADLADVLLAKGDDAAATAAAKDALLLYEGKGHRVAAEDLRNQFPGIEGSAA